MNLQTVKNQKGFTIVELLIVIVVIGILAAITIVAFNGVQNRGKSASAQSEANAVVKKLEAWNSVVGQYPTYCQFVTNTTNGTGTATGIGAAGCTAGTANSGPMEAKLDNANDVASTAGSVTSSNGTSVVYLSNMSSAGAYVNYYNYTASSPALTTSATTPSSPRVGSPS